MALESRAHKSLLNARTNLIFYLLVLLVTFFSRRLFLEKLGDDFIGLTSTLSNLLGLLNLAELGVGSAIGYMLYKPLVESNREEVNRIVTVLGYVYRKIGLIVVAAAAILAIFLPWILQDTPFSYPLVYFTYVSYLISAVLGYFINYRQLLLGADQRQYVVTAYYQSANILRLLIQMLVLYKTSNPYYWVAIEITFAFVYSGILNWRIDKAYPWLKTNLRQGRILLKEYPQMLKYTKQIFVHKVGATALFNLSPIFVYAYTTLTMVAYYTNYVLITEKIRLLFTQLLGSADAGIGQLVAEGNREQIQKVFSELFALRYWVAGILTGTLWFSVNPFIELWLGTQYLLPETTVFLILLNLFIMLTRIAESFNMAYGLFYDTWAPITEAGLNAALSMLLGHFWGLNGVLLGTTCSMLVIVVIWKPYFLFSKGFHRPVWHYWKKVSGYMAILASVYFVLGVANQLHSVNPAGSFWIWVLYTCCVAATLSVLLFALMYVCTTGMRTLTSRMIAFVKNKLYIIDRR